MDSLESLTAALQPLSIVIASGVAIWGISAWRREHVGRKRIDLAEEILRAFYEAKEAISGIRSPMGSGGEGSTRKRRATETPQESQVLDNAYVAIERFNKRSELFGNLWALRYRAKVLFGSEAVQAFDEVNRVVGEVIAAARMLGHYWVRQGHGPYPEGFDRHLAEMNRLEAIFWENPNEDPLRTRIEGAIDSIESVCKPAIEQFSAPVRSWTWIKDHRIPVGVAVVLSCIVAGLTLWRCGNGQSDDKSHLQLIGSGTWCVARGFSQELNCNYFSERQCIELGLLDSQELEYCVPRPVRIQD